MIQHAKGTETTISSSDRTLSTEGLVEVKARIETSASHYYGVWCSDI